MTNTGGAGNGVESKEATKNEELDDTAWFSFSDESDELESDFRAYQDSLIPKKSQANGVRVLRFYYLWLILILMHILTFWVLPLTVKECYKTP